MNLATRALVIGCGIEALFSGTLLYGSFGPCSISLLGVVAVVLHVPGAAVGAALSALLGLPSALETPVMIAAQAAFRVAAAYVILRIRLALARRRADALPTI